MYTAVVAEDNIYIRENLISELNRHSFKIVGETNNGKDLIQLVYQKHPDVIFVDIDMPVLNGIEASLKIKEVNPDVFIIFITGYINYAIDAFEIHAFDYIVKPFSKERFDRSIIRIKKNLNKNRKSSNLYIKVKNGYRIIANQDIVYITSELKSTKVYLANSKDPILTTESLSSLEDRLDSEIFFRTHRSYIANLNYIERIEPTGRTNLIYFKKRKDYIYLSSRFLPIIFNKFN